ncbi:putative membrane protein [Thermocatellispora tengchongensis]|uniref:Putative membrane protein n=1 Tax=Thermocatellispora tengchongensis TaxID=1073253 RepID=A0A840PJW1_9ACTN|nr:NEW3 domain-containing protein [Thermocatellispora tengchongensis]MBB5139249.1 putative membrane protein [Thermocatellispora tengchongensis]
MPRFALAHPLRPRRATSAPAFRRTAALLAALALLLGWQTVAAPAAHAAISLSTPYPAVVVEPGDNVSLDLTIDSSPPQRVDLDVDAPKGWRTTLRGGGFVVSSVRADDTEVTLDVTVPADADGTRRVTVIATGEDGERSRLPVSLSVRGGKGGSVGLEAEFAQLTGTATDTFSYSVTLRNDTSRETEFALSATGPSGWEVSAHPSGQDRARTVKVDAGGTATIDVTADPPDTVTAGTYPIRLAAGGGEREAAAELAAQITGSAEMTLSTPDERLNASGSTGERTRIPLVLSNKGTAPLTGVSLTSSPPSGWQVTFEPATVNLAPRQTARVTAVVTPSDDAVTGDYMVTLTAQKDGQQSSADIRYTVETSRWWGLAGVLVIVAVAAGLWYVFRVYGRR